MVIEHAKAWSRLEGTDERPLGGPSDRLIWRWQKRGRNRRPYRWGGRRPYWWGGRRPVYVVRDNPTYYWYNPGYWFNGYWFEGFQNERNFNCSFLLVLILILVICIQYKKR